jgi:hypothetical protein
MVVIVSRGNRTHLGVTEEVFKGGALSGGHVLIGIVVGAVVTGVAVEHAVHAHDQPRRLGAVHRLEVALNPPARRAGASSALVTSICILLRSEV